jgi:very-short-patch-repair endonuclease
MGRKACSTGLDNREEERKEALTTAYLSEQGYQVMRFWQVNTEMQNGLKAIYAALTDSNRAPQKAH